MIQETGQATSLYHTISFDLVAKNCSYKLFNYLATRCAIGIQSLCRKCWNLVADQGAALQFSTSCKSSCISTLRN